MTGISYMYSEHYMGEALPIAHAEAIKARGEWIPGVIDYAAEGSSQRDGKKLADEYRDLGLHLSNANKAVDAGILATLKLLSTGRLKVFNTLGYFAAEYMLYRRNENGKIIKENDHLIDCLRYWVMSGRDVAAIKPNLIDVVGAGGNAMVSEAGY